MKPLLPFSLPLLGLCLGYPGAAAHAFERLAWRAETVEMPGGYIATGVSATLHLRADGTAAAEASLASLRTTRQTPQALDTLRLQCDAVIVSEPRFACQRGNLSIKQSPLGELRAGVEAEFHSTRSALQLRVDRLALAGGQVAASVRWQRNEWQLSARAQGVKLPEALRTARPWWQLPAQFTLDGEIQATVEASGRAARIEALQASLDLRQLALQNEAGDIVTESVAAQANVHASGTADDLAFRGSIRGSGGQALAGPVLLDMTRDALTLTASGRFTPKAVSLDVITVEQPQLIDARGKARLARESAWLIDSGEFEVAALRFPAAYTSLLQLTLAATEFGALETRGVASGSMQLRRNRLAALDLRLQQLHFEDSARRLAMHDIDGDIHWRAAALSRPADSQLRWGSLRAYGLEGGGASLDFASHGSRLSLTQPARLPLFDGALLLQRFDAGQLGTSNVELDVDAVIEPISMARLSRSFGWPEMSGQLAGRIPGLEFRRGTLRFAGDLGAQVFDGRIGASNLQLRDAFGKFPRLSGNLVARNLDLALITRTFPIGSITGRLDAEISGLELFGWSPVAFDATLYTTPGDNSRHRISQRAVGNLAKLGGGGGGVVAALQSGLLRFFDDFGYDRLGLHCRLREDICTMGGIGPAPNGGYYIVKGGGLPRIDVIGNSTRVAWAQLLGQIDSALESQDVVVK